MTTTITLTPAALLELRRLRLWHWDAMADASRDASVVPGNWPRLEGMTDAQYRIFELARVEECRERFSLHLGAVQALNDLFPVGETAENDRVQVARHGRLPGE